MKIGIDLGTTNSALAYIDPAEAEDADFPPIHVLEIPQLIAPGTVEARATLPSFLYLDQENEPGIYAREQGALIPTRSVHSAKSWLSNPDVDRTAKILPWDAQEAGRVMSPVEVSAKFLAHIRKAWEAQKHSLIANHDIVLTVPASFDEEARELTVAAAAEAGLEKITLIEEPAAAFYAWIAHHLAASQKSLFDGQIVLVCDVGGGTSDFTLIRVSREGDRVDFTRTAVGKHLLLGGDNLDLTLGWLVEAKLGVPLSLKQRTGLRRQCAVAKEALLSDAAPESFEIRLLGSGTSLIGGALKTEITRAEALELALEGFLPFCDVTDQPKEEKKSVFRELGLPYVSDAAINRHLAAFLTSAGGPPPDAILFNGGFFIPDVCRQRVADVLAKWYGRRPLIFENRNLDLAVAIGAAYYSYVRSTGAGLLVRGGLPRAYYIGLDSAEKIRAVCLVPRGTEEGSTLELDIEGLQLVANRPVSFRLYSSLVRTEDRVGDIVEFDAEQVGMDLNMHAPLQAVIRFGKRTGERTLPVKLGARLTEVGTLDIWAESKLSENRWRLQFELRKQAGVDAPKPRRAAAVVSDEAVTRAEELLRDTFASGNGNPAELPAKLEQTLGLGRNSWPGSVIRRLADRMLELADGRKRSAAHEQRWLNLCGFCLRPGFGYPGDEFRLEQARRVYAGGLTFASHIQSEIEWYIFWGRVAGGLNRNQQTDLFQRIAPLLLPKKEKDRKRVNASLLRELWRTASSLELLPVGVKTELGEALIKRVRAGDFRESELWCLSRIGARKLFYGPNNLVIPPSTAARWAETLLRIPIAGEAIASIARKTGDATRDLPVATLEAGARELSSRADAARLLAIFEGDEAEGGLESMGRVFGEELPSGLVLETAGSAETAP